MVSIELSATSLSLVYVMFGRYQLREKRVMSYCPACINLTRIYHIIFGPSEKHQREMKEPARVQSA